MGVGYASDALALIVADHNGLTKEEILEINEKTYYSQLDHYFDQCIGPGSFVEQKGDGKYYLQEGIGFEVLQRSCRLGAQIGFNNHGHRPKFWKGNIQAE